MSHFPFALMVGVFAFGLPLLPVFTLPRMADQCDNPRSAPLPPLSVSSQVLEYSSSDISSRWGMVTGM